MITNAQEDRMWRSWGALRSLCRKKGWQEPDCEFIDYMQARAQKHCDLCLTDRAFRYVFDHCHNTGRPRGTLCNSCNGALGVLGDNEKGLTRALNYVKLKTREHVNN